MSLLESLTRGRLAIIPGALAAGALVLAGCSSDGDGGGGSDEEFVADLCGGLQEFADELTSVITDADPNEDEAFEKLADAVRKFADTLEDTDPPSDVEDARDSMVSSLREAADGLADGNEDAFADVGEGADLELDQDVQDRLQAVAEDTDACVELEESGFGGIFGDAAE